MSGALFPLTFGSDDFMLLTAIVLGFFFGLALERGGFGNARKLAAQFYFYDMTVFKVMFTAIVVAMVGLYSLAAMGLMDLSRLWINLTYLPSQAVGGFLLGVGFIMSGLCPGTSVVSAASGRWDAVVTMVGIFAGTALFAVAVDLFPALESLYYAGSGEVSVLPTVFGLPPLVFTLIILVVAGVGFIGAEKVEVIFQKKYGMIDLTPPTRPRLKLAVVGASVLVAVAALGLRPSAPGLPPIQSASIAPMTLAEALIGKTPGLMILDMRADAANADQRIPGSYPAATPEEAKTLLASAPVGATVVLVNEDGAAHEIPADWRRNLDYRWLQDGFQGWETKVLTPAAPGTTLADHEWANRQGQVSAYFSGAAVQVVEVKAPPAMAGAGAEKPKKKGGC